MIELAAATLCLLAQGPVGYWRGDDGTSPTSAADSSGNGRNGTYTSGATTSAATLPPGLFNNASAFQLDGADDEITIPHNAAFNITGDLTVAFWMRKTAESGDWTRIVGKGAPAVRTFGVWEEAGPARHILFQQYDGSNAPVAYVLSAGEVAVDTWTHVACVVEANNCTIYLNGASASATVARTGTVATDSQPVRIGYGEMHNRFPGQVDEVRIFNRALQLTEIQTLAGMAPVQAVPQNLRITSSAPGSISLAWDAAAGATSYVLQRSDPVAGPFNTIATVTGTTYTDTGLTNGATYSYTVYAVGLVSSADATPTGGMVPFPPPRTNDHEEGLLGDGCACGSTASGLPGAWALLALLLLGARLRRP